MEYNYSDDTEWTDVGFITLARRDDNEQVRSTGQAGLDGLEAILGPCFGLAVGSICPASFHHL